MLGEEAQGLQNLLEKAMESRTEQSLKACGLTVLASPLENGYIVLQLKGEDLQKLREQMEDTMQTNSATRKLCPILVYKTVLPPVTA